MAPQSKPNPKPTPNKEDSDYDSASDEDFNPEGLPADDEEISSSSDDEAPETATTAPGRKPRKGTKRVRVVDVVDAEWDSGDEAIAKKKRRKGKEDSDEEGGDGGFVRTRAQRRGEKVERRALVSTAGSTLDVESVWSRLSALPVGRPKEEERKQQEENEEDYVVIKRTTRFAGTVTTEERRVLKSSKEAVIYLEELEKGKKKELEPESIEEAKDEGAEPGLPLRRPLKRVLKFDPNPLGEVKGLPSNLQLRWPRDKLAPIPPTAAVMGVENKRALPKLPEAAKLNTVQKSKYDWAGYVDKSNLAEELDEYGKSKESYLGRREFLGRVEGAREEERLRGR